ncbi:MAG: transcriptional regulator CysB [Betaproteobacteria bacterium RIFCSPLOWO2_12_FULL_62_13]|nr:MAG: transcriptional regulator CysB [Betaproteobacteria bacterium RIFCSPLOWO2_12_FULL_62_13]
MTLQQLRYLCEVVRENLNISKAAQALHVSQPGLSRQLQLLEKELEVELFVRNRKRLVRLSQAGSQIFSLAERTLNDARNIKEAASECSAQNQGALTIATTHTQARYALPDIIRRFAKRYPKVQLSLRQGTPAEVSRLVSSGSADLSIATEPLEPPADIVLLPCYQLPRIVLAPARHPLLKVKRLTLEKLAAYPLITYDYSFIGRSKILRAFEARGIHPNIVLNAIDADVIKTYVESGLGIAIVPSMAFDRARDRNLRGIDARHLFEPNTIHVGIRRNHYLRGYMYSFIEMFAPHLKRPVVEKAITESATRTVREGGLK